MLLLKVRDKFFHANDLGRSIYCHATTVVVAEHNRRKFAQVGPKDHFARHIKGVGIN
jgi:hypothetical protein